MTFLTSPSWFAWLAAALLPVALWWLFRRRRMVMEWSANYLLRRTLKATAKRNLWRQTVILALRTLAILLVVLALAKPFLPQPPGAGELPHGDGVLHQIVLVDNSRSMSIGYGPITREEEMRGRLRDLLARMRPGDVCEVILLALPEGETASAIRLTCPVSEDALHDLEAQLVLLDRPAALQDGIQLAAERFHVTGADHRHLVLLSDLTAKDLPDTAALQSLRREFKRLQVRFAAYEIRDRARGNLALISLDYGGETLCAGWQYHLYLELRNYGDAPAASALTVRTLHGDRLLDTRQVAVDLGPDERRTIDLPLTVPEVEGTITLVAEVNDDGAAYDNRRSLRLHVAGQARLLLITDPAEAAVEPDLWRDSYYVQLALSALQREPAAAARPVTSGTATTLVRDPLTGALRPQTHKVEATTAAATTRPNLKVVLDSVTTDDLPADPFADRDAVILLGVNDLPAEQRQQLAQFVERGGGLLIALGPSVFADNFNPGLGQLAGLQLRGLMDPAGRATRDWDYDAPYREIEKTFDHPVLRPLLAEEQGPIENVRIYNHFRLLAGSEATPLIDLNNGDPLLVENVLGRGRVLTWTSTLGGAWNTLPVRNMYVNVLYACLTRCLHGANLPRNLAPGAPLLLDAPDGDLFVTRPGVAVAVGPLPVRVVHGRPMARLDETPVGGAYSVLRESAEAETVEVFAPPMESDTRSFNEDERSAFAAHSGASVLRDWSGMAAALAASETPGTSLVGALAIVLLLILATDAWLTRRWFP